jgi:hypothetical protein
MMASEWFKIGAAEGTVPGAAYRLPGFGVSDYAKACEDYKRGFNFSRARAA